MADITVAIDVEVPCRVAYDQWSRFEEWPDFMPDLKGLERPNDVHLRWIITVDGRPVPFDDVITQQVPGDRIAWRTADGDTGHTGLVTFRPTGESSCRITFQLTTFPEGAAEQFGDQPGVEKGRAVRILRNFKKHIESTWRPPV
ncbi:SRPBCC family protein [Nocardiopsis sediminis]|uniref:SRPBCC family protein n=1 Tax=Nocardiopsis sediminis TaxID=1778267 RepID=A0ABV8FIK0_9ACTN